METEKKSIIMKAQKILSVRSHGVNFALFYGRTHTYQTKYGACAQKDCYLGMLVQFFCVKKNWTFM